MKRRVCIITAIVAFLTLVGGALAISEPSGQTVKLSPNGKSGISGTATVNGKSVTAKAKGFDPDSRYISLFYDEMSTGQSGKQLTCAAARTAISPRTWGISPEWTVNEDGTGTLRGKSGVDSDQAKTMSIRKVPASADEDDPYSGFNPVQYPVVACGTVNDSPDGPATNLVNQVPTDTTKPVTDTASSLLGSVN